MSDKTEVPSPAKDVRCLCGRLTARLEKGGVVVKCNRCGEFVVISLSKIKGLKKLLKLP